jgi:hypothetical protein
MAEECYDVPRQNRPVGPMRSQRDPTTADRPGYGLPSLPPQSCSIRSLAMTALSAANRICDLSQSLLGGMAGGKYSGQKTPTLPDKKASLRESVLDHLEELVGRLAEIEECIKLANDEVVGG